MRTKTVNKTLTAMILSAAIVSITNCDNIESRNLQSIRGRLVSESYSPKQTKESLFGIKQQESSYEIVVERFSDNKRYRFIIGDASDYTKEDLKQKLSSASSITIQDPSGNSMNVRHSSNKFVEGIIYTSARNINQDDNKEYKK